MPSLAAPRTSCRIAAHFRYGPMFHHEVSFSALSPFTVVVRIRIHALDLAHRFAWGRSPHRALPGCLIVCLGDSLGGDDGRRVWGFDALAGSARCAATAFARTRCPTRESRHGQGPAMKQSHPIADEFTAECNVYRASSSRVTLSMPLWAFIMDSRSASLRPVLVTRADSHVSRFVLEELRAANGQWAVDTGSGVYDARSGYRLRGLSELWTGVPAGRHRLEGFEAARPNFVGALSFDVHVRARADKHARVGPVVRHVFAGLGGAIPQRWGRHDPLTQPWSEDALTEELRREMPVARRRYVAGSGGSVGSVSAARSRDGALVQARGVVPIGAYERPVNGASLSLEAVPAVLPTLVELGERFVPNVALVSYVQVEERLGSIGQSVGLRRADVPVAALIGARAVRDLRIDVARVREEFGAVPVGSRRAPSLIVGFSELAPFWHRLRAFAHDLDEERLGVALSTELGSV